MAEKGKYMNFNKVNKCVLYVAIKINIIDCWDELIQYSSKHKEEIGDLGITERYWTDVIELRQPIEINF